MYVGVVLCPDIGTIGFLKYVRNRLRALGITVVWPPRGVLLYDHLLVDFARRHNAWIVTCDSYLMVETGYDKVIVLPHGNKLPTQKGRPRRRTYEEWWVILCRQLHRIAHDVQ